MEKQVLSLGFLFFVGKFFLYTQGHFGKTFVLWKLKNKLVEPVCGLGRVDEKKVVLDGTIWVVVLFENVLPALSHI